MAWRSGLWLDEGLTSQTADQTISTAHRIWVAIGQVTP
jgi:hypothetical protein